MMLRGQAGVFRVEKPDSAARTGPDRAAGKKQQKTDQHR